MNLKSISKKIDDFYNTETSLKDKDWRILEDMLWFVLWETDAHICIYIYILEIYDNEMKVYFICL